MNSPASIIGERLKEIRTNRKLSLDEAARLTEVSKPMLGQIERGQSIPTITTLWKIATGLKVPLSSFLEDRHNQGVEEYVFVLKGKLQLVLNGKELVVGEKQAIRFRADIPHAYHNPFSEKCAVYNTIFYPNC